MISNKIEQLRKEKNVKQTDIAQAIGFTVSGYQKAIQANDFKVSTLEKIAEALEVPVTYFFEDSGDKHFLSEIFLEIKGAKEEINTVIFLFLYVQYQKFFFNDSEVIKLLTETYKKEYNEFLKKFPESNNISTFRTCAIFFSRYYNPVKNIDELESMINRINGDFFTAINNNKSILWLLKNDFITAGFMVTSIGKISNEFINMRQFFEETEK
jgi:transcriptional regulator with XRE-family HTH domain